MLSTSLGPLLTLVLLTGSEPLPAVHPNELEGHRIELAPDSPLELYDVWISPGLATTLVFDSHLEVKTIELEDAAGFILVRASRHELTLVPLNALTPGSSSKLTVRFGEGTSPASASFKLRVDPKGAQRQVEVSRPQRALGMDSRESGARTEQGQVGHECPDPRSSLMSKAVSKMMEEGTFSVWDITERVEDRSKTTALKRFIGYHSMRSPASSRRRVLFLVELTLSSSESRRVTSAKVRRHGSQEQLEVWQEPGAPGGELHLLLEGSLDVDPLQHHDHVLLLTMDDGSNVSLDNIMLR